MEAQQLYRAKEFAQRAGVSVRTLHFYDRLGLLKPAARTRAGYRLYGEAELERLEQILALRFVRFQLDRIKKLLSGPPQPLMVALHMQRQIVANELHRLKVAHEAIERAQESLESADEAGRWQAVQNVIEAFKMKEDYSWTENYYSPEAREKLAKERARLGEAGMQKAQQDWAELIAEVEVAAKNGEDPKSEHAQSLRKRWRDLVTAFTQNDPDICAGLQAMYADTANHPSHFKRMWSDEADAFIAATREV